MAPPNRKLVRRPAAERPLWTCARCGHSFVNRNQWHSCRRCDLSEPFAGTDARVRDLFDRLHAIVQSFGPVKLQPYRDKVAFVVRVRFAGAFPRKRALDVGFWLTRAIDSPRFLTVERLGPTTFIYRVRVTDASQFDTELRRWLRESYRVGCQDHLAR
jgi:hypothetical protein